MWDLIIRKTTYSKYVISREVKGTSKVEDLKREKEPKKLEFELND